LTNWSHIISPVQSHAHAHGSHGPEQVHKYESLEVSEAESLTLSDTPLYNPVHKCVLRKQRRDFPTLSTPLDCSVVKNMCRQYLESVSKFSRSPKRLYKKVIAKNFQKSVRPGLDEIDSETGSEIESESDLEDFNLAAGTRSKTGSLLTEDEKRTGFLKVAPPPSGARQRSKSPEICIRAPFSESADSVYLDTVEGTESPSSETDSEMSATKTLTEEQKGIVDTANQLAELLLKQQKAAALDAQEQTGKDEQKQPIKNVDPTLAAVVNLGMIPAEYASSIGDLQKCHSTEG
jgi:hypothetical protein